MGVPPRVATWEGPDAVYARSAALARWPDASVCVHSGNVPVYGCGHATLTSCYVTPTKQQSYRAIR